LALHASDTHRTLVVSTDPAPSLGDALGLNIPDADTPVGGDQTRLFARQMNATDAFERLRIEYASRVDALMEGLAGRGVHVTHDGAIARELLRLAPPGVDEVYAMSLLSDVVFDGRYERVIVDPAPTGHLLRLLEMPQLALSWCHQLLRLMLKYKEITGLGDTARELLEFSKRLRELDALLTDASRCGVVVVSLDEPIVHGESERLVREVNARGVSITGVVVNRTTGAVALPVRGAPMQLVAPDTDPSPVGVDALREWSSRWSLTSDGDSRVD
jgi:arsenite-transporting ATPase